MDKPLMVIAWRKIPGKKHTHTIKGGIVLDPEHSLYEFQCPQCGHWQGSWGANRWEAQLDIMCIKCGRDLSPVEEA